MALINGLADQSEIARIEKAGYTLTIVPQNESDIPNPYKESGLEHIIVFVDCNVEDLLEMKGDVRNDSDGTENPTRY